VNIDFCVQLMQLLIKINLRMTILCHMVQLM